MPRKNRRGRRNKEPVREKTDPPEDTEPDETSDDEGEAPHLAEVGDRYKIPPAQFLDVGEGQDDYIGVVTERVRGYTKVWFNRGSRGTQYRGRLEGWSDFWVDPNTVINEADEKRFQELEIRAGIRARPRPAPPSRDLTRASVDNGPVEV